MFTRFEQDHVANMKAASESWQAPRGFNAVTCVYGKRNEIISENKMWMMILMSGKWYARCENRLRTRKILNDAFTLINEGTIVSICDDLETWCDELGVDMKDVVIVKNEDGGLVT